MLPFFGRNFVYRRYARTHLGWLWIPLRPAFDVGARVLLFGAFLGVSSGDRPYFMFFIMGTSAWILFERSAFWATRALEMNRTLLSRVNVSKLPAVAASVVPGGLDFLLYFTIALCGAVYYKWSEGTSYLVISGRSLAVAATGLALLALLGVVLGLVTAPLAAETRDVRFVARYVLGFWFFLTPIVYPVSSIPERYRPIAEYNPVTAPVEMVKYGMLDTAPPSRATVVVTLVFLAVVLPLALSLFARFERAHAERIR